VSDSQLYLLIAVWSQIVSSIVFIALLIYMWIRWIMPVVLSAQERSNRQIAEAERHRDEVKGALEALRQQIATANHDAELIAERASTRGEHERELLVKEATEAGERVLADAGRELERARAAARLQLRHEILQRALGLAREDAARRVGPNLDARFVDRFTGDLEHAARG
jgi:F-type H+-transporting ATPase subunit b